MSNILESTFRYKGYQCVVLFTELGHRCGYVYVPYWHKQYEVDYDDIPVKCHGGLTYSDHRLMDKEYPGWWIGFDCAHAGDMPDRESQIRYFGNTKQDSFFNMLNFMTGNYSGDFGTVKTLDYCEQECRDIVEQLRKLE